MSFGEREQYIITIYVFPRMCVLYRGVTSLEVFLRRGTTILEGANFRGHRAVSQKILGPLVTLSMEKTMAAKVISELKSVCRLKIFPETGPTFSKNLKSTGEI